MVRLEAWLKDLGLAQYCSVLAENDIDFDTLLELEERDLEKLGFSLGHRRKLKKAMTRVELLTAFQDVQKRLKRNPAWKKLSKDKQDELLNEIVGDLDSDEEMFQVD